VAILAVQRGWEAAEEVLLAAQVRRVQHLKGMPGVMATLMVAVAVVVRVLSAEPIPRHLERQQAPAGAVVPLQLPARLLQEPVALAVAVAVAEQAAGVVAVVAVGTAAAVFNLVIMVKVEPLTRAVGGVRMTGPVGVPGEMVGLAL
jgi:hypothetical protein